MSGSLRTTEFNESQPWRTKHLKSIEMNCRKASRFNEWFPKIQALLWMPKSNLPNYCWHHLRFWLEELNIVTRIVRNLSISSSKSDLALDLCRHFGARKFFSGFQGCNYLVESDFKEAGVATEYQSFNSPNLSVLAWRMNVSEASFLSTKS